MLEMLKKAFGDYTLSKTRVFEWYKMFKEGRECVEDEPCSGRPSTLTDEQHVAQVEDLVFCDYQLTIRDIIEHVPVSFGSCQAILKDHLGLWHVASQVVLKMLNFFQKQQYVQVANAFLR
ncbi:putative uncharacterized protein FLJ37770 [Centruroides sculpturatus]|uniref:putative uncharacterized protein FLJ37770 n=1 Tax=Centruroides sculpturatus TaxID=218467 RepID=UPI000C6EF1F2|nr:putative uncharacterized protein FLJ37770 [Centruroides sculpturatus]